ncbi:MAG: tocopherol cyclase family protein, partial [Halobacteria archaeon]
MRQGTGNEPHFGWALGEGERGREVWYSLVTLPDSDLAFWYRYTLLSTDSGHREARLWAGLTRDDGDDFLTTRRYPLDDAVLDELFALSFGDARLTDSSARGALETDVADVSWSFEYEPDETTFTPLRSEKLTDFAEKFLGSGRHWSANQSVAMDGTLEVDGETYDFEDAPGHQGHTVGETSPEGWSWLHCNCFDEDGVIEILNVEGKTSLCFRLGGETYLLNRLKHV